MQYLTRAILSSFLPRFALQSRGIKVVLALAGAAVLLLAGVMLSRLRGSSTPALSKELGLKPLQATDEKGDQWTLEPVVGQPFARLRQAPTEPGPPLTVRTDLWPEGTDRVLIGLTIEGRAGERYNPKIRKNGALLPEPQFTVVNETGVVMVQGRFEYG